VLIRVPVLSQEYLMKHVAIPSSMLTLVITSLAFAAPAAHATLALQASGGANVGVPGGQLYGWAFTTNSAITVDGLGVSGNSPSPGLLNQVVLYDINRNVLASAVIGAGSTAQGTGLSFQVTSIAPVNLNANTTYFIAEATQNGNTNWLGSAFSTISAISYLGSIQSSALSPLPVTIGQPTAGGWFGPNFTVTTAVPEPTSQALFLVGMAAALGVAGVRRCQS